MTDTEKLLKTIALHLEDISKSLRLMSGREEVASGMDILRPKTYAEKYLAPSPIKGKEK